MHMSKSILIADDNAATRQVMLAYLELAGLKVCGFAEDGRDVTTKVPVLKPSLVILDLAMPQMNGLEAARTLNQIMPELPLVLFTFHDGVICQSEAADFGIDAVVPKSAGMNALVREVRRLLRRV
jgi:CheY-like chemotaxis protein